MWYEQLSLNSDYRILAFEQLNKGQRERYSGLRKRGMYGLLMPVVPGGMLPKPIDSALNHFIRARENGVRYGEPMSSSFLNAVRALIVEGALGVRSEGSFATGLSILNDFGGLKEWVGVMDATAEEQIAAAIATNVTDVSTLSEMLYRSLPSQVESVKNRKEIIEAVQQKTTDTFSVIFKQIESSPAPDWTIYTSRDDSESLDTAGAYKLYICPETEVLTEIISQISEVLASSGASFIKVVNAVSGLNRPDKIVAYFDYRHELAHCAMALNRCIGNFPGRALPFSCSLTPDGLLSWAVNPFPAVALFYSVSPGSWRKFVCDRIASAIVIGKRDSNRSLELPQYVSQYLHEIGISPDCWLPVEEAEMGLMIREPQVKTAV